MSQMTSSARVGARALNRPTTTTPRLRVVTGAPPRRGGAAFGVICAILLAAGLIGLLVLNTALAQGSFTLQQLQASSEQLSDAEGALNQSLAASKSPAVLASRASSMGMVPAQSAAFLRLSDGKVIGVAEPAKPGPGFTVVGTTASPPRPAPKRPTKPVPGLASKSLVKPAPAPAAKSLAKPAPAPAATRLQKPPTR